MHPVVVNSTRIAVRDTILPTGGGEDGKSPILVQKGWMLQTHPYSLHRSKATYENADEFIPERWEHLRQGWQFLPFSGGPRICPAQQMALTEATYTMFCLAKKFKEIRSEDSRPWTEAIALTVWNVNGVRISLVPA
jgi:cytochrome P450